MKEELHYSYTVFGLSIISEIPLPELIPIEADDVSNPKILLKLGEVQKPEEGLENTFYGRMQIYNTGFYFLTLEDFGSFYLTKEDEYTLITMHVVDESQLVYLKSWLYGSVLTAALQMNDRFALHASAVIVNDELFMFCGNSGIGKSTLASQLHSRGYNIFSDDKCVLFWHKSEERFYAYPTLRIARLWKDATDKINDTSFLESPQSVALKKEKYQYLLSEDVYISTPKPIKRIYRIHNLPEDRKLQVFNPTGVRKIKQLQAQTHRLNFVKGLGKTKVHWEYLEQIIKKVSYAVLGRPRNTPIEDFVDFVEHQIKSS